MSFLSIEQEEFQNKVAKRVLIFSTLAFILYGSITIWRFVTVERYTEALEFSDVDASELGSTEILSANYGVLAFGAFLIYSCGVIGIKKKSAEMTGLMCTFSGCCMLVSIVSLTGILLTGDLCSKENRDQCGYLTTAYRWTIVTTLCLFTLYSITVYYSARLMASKEYWEIKHTTPVIRSRPNYVQSNLRTVATPIEPKKDESPPTAPAPRESIPYAEPVY